MRSGDALEHAIGLDKITARDPAIPAGFRRIVTVRHSCDGRLDSTTVALAPVLRYAKGVSSANRAEPAMPKPKSAAPAAASQLSHLNEKGEANMVDVSAKDVTHRVARAEGFVAMQAATLAMIETGTAKKGDVLATARIAGIMAAKKTHELIPLCHPLAITKATVTFEPSQKPAGIHVTAQVKVSGQTGVEMEALTAVSVACLTIYDMLKAADKGMTISGIRLLKKTGGRSGTYKTTDK